MVQSAFPVNFGKRTGPAGAKALPMPSTTFVGTSAPITYDLCKECASNQIDEIQGLWVDNTQNGRAVFLTFDSTFQVIEIPTQFQGYIPSLWLGGNNFMTGNVKLVSLGTGIFNFSFLNFTPPNWWQGMTGTNSVVADFSGTQSGADITTAPLNYKRTGLIIANQGAAAMAFNFGAAAVINGAGSITLAPGAAITLTPGACPLDAVHTIGTATQNYTVKELTQ